MKLNKYRESFCCNVLVVPTTLKKVFSRCNFSESFVQVLSSMHSNVQLLYLSLFFSFAVRPHFLRSLIPLRHFTRQNAAGRIILDTWWNPFQKSNGLVTSYPRGKTTRLRFETRGWQSMNIEILFGRNLSFFYVLFKRIVGSVQMPWLKS